MDLYSALGPLLRHLEPERAHALTLRALRWGLAPAHAPTTDPILRQHIWGIDFSNPIGLAAGFDKNAEAVDGLFQQGFGFVEVGTVTPRPQPGNARPRVFRLPEDDAVINRLGFNSAGVAVVRDRLAALHSRGVAGPVGVNVGKNRDRVDAPTEYAWAAGALAPYADYVTINVSSPNTPGLRDLQGADKLGHLIARVREAMDAACPEGAPPLLLKVAPDLEMAAMADIASVVFAQHVDGLIVGNTTTSRPKALRGGYRTERGGLSGRPLFELSTHVLKTMYALTEGQVPIVGVGGIASGADAYAKIRAGASLVQLYTALIYHGPALVPSIASDLAARLRADGFESIAAAVGADA
ncbi:dihydroorotate oxidase A [Limimonas halophila]|uniref:Dihydroorotate dehydrogenase (quinone) n=1 Tax=Limimonas halophila TaxID=1082479 RepID=A0A1G7UZQ6_9PROT|nr:quinone-dependent dihydroorotate dehydrogenase [Limimonas halophila]SDG53052.1 dihydroorotate oxidase A [Limimonas halophila]